MKQLKTNILSKNSLWITCIAACLILGFVQSHYPTDSLEQNIAIIDKQKQLPNRLLAQQQTQQHSPLPIQKILWLYTSSYPTPHQKSHNKQPPTSNANSSQNKQPLSSLLPEQQQLFNQVNILNTRHFAQIDNYTVIEVNQNNYHEHLSSDDAQKIRRLIQVLGDHGDNSQGKNLQLQEVNGKEDNTTLKDIIKRVIIYSVILENGGIFIDNRVTLVQPLDHWIQKLPSSPFINPFIQPSNNNPYCLAFYNDSFSSMKENRSPNNEINGEKFVVMYPNVEDYFLACGKGNIFLKKLIDSYVNLLIKGNKWEGFETLSTDVKLIGLTNPHLIYQHGHYIASHYVLQQQQSTLDRQQSSNQLAVSTLSLYTINSRLGPQKLLNQFSIENYKTYIYLLKLNIQELQLFVGPLRFMYMLNDDVVKIIVRYLLKYESDTVFVEKDSFVHKYWIKHLIQEKDNQKFKNVWEFVQTYRVVRENLAKNTTLQNELLSRHTQIQSSQVKRIVLDQTKPKWKSLQKNIWIIWDNGIEGKSNLIVQLCYQNLKKSSQKSGFTIHAVSKENIQQYISEQTLSRISSAVKHSAFDLGSQAISDLWRLALVYQNGGVYFDASTFMIDESFDWITQITQFPQYLIWNRYGTQPEVFMFWNAYYRNAVNWHIDRKFKTRAQWQLSLESNFIAATKGSELIKEWFQVMLQWITLPFDEVEKQMKSVGMYQNRWTSDSFWQQGRYLTVMDAIKYVLGRRQKLIKNQKYIKLYQNSGDYYKLWSIPGQFLGQQKLRGQTNYENRDYRLDKQHREIDNIYKYQYPMKQVEKVLGPIQFQGKFFNWQLIMMNKMLNDFYRQNRENFTIDKLKEIIYPESIVAVKLLNSNKQKTMELLQHYEQLTEIKVKVKGFNKIWSY